MADENGTSNESALPPKLDLRKQGILKPQVPSGADVAPVAPKETSRFEVKPAESAAAPEPAASDKKRETSRIPLEEAKPAPEADAGDAEPKTIRIKPLSVSGKPVLSPLRITAPGGGDAEAAAGAAKRKTSRIPLEAALTGAPEPAAGEGPKTIKIRRPSSPGTVKLKQPSHETQRAPRPDQLMETSQLDHAAVGEPITQKKTIRVKRPTITMKAGQQAQVARPASTLFVPPPMETPEDEPGWFYGVAGVAALLVLGAVIWMLCAQAIGPNKSMTELSYARNAVDLPWPGKL